MSASSVTNVNVQYKGRRNAIKVSSNSVLHLVLKEACTHFDVDPAKHSLVHKNSNVLDVSLPIRLSGLSNNVVLDLELTSSLGRRASATPTANRDLSKVQCKLAISLDGAASGTKVFPASATLQDVLNHALALAPASASAAQEEVQYSINLPVSGLTFNSTDAAELTSHVLFDLGLANQSSRINIRRISAAATTAVADVPSPPAVPASEPALAPTVQPPPPASAPTAATAATAAAMEPKAGGNPAVDAAPSVATSGAVEQVQEPQQEAPAAPTPSSSPQQLLQAYNSFRPHFKKHLEHLLSSNFTAVTQPAVMLLIRYINNLISHPPPPPSPAAVRDGMGPFAEDAPWRKFHQIRCSNTAFRGTLLGLTDGAGGGAKVHGAMELLFALGFIPTLPAASNSNLQRGSGIGSKLRPSMMAMEQDCEAVRTPLDAQEEAMSRIVPPEAMAMLLAGQRVQMQGAAGSGLGAEASVEAGLDDVVLKVFVPHHAQTAPGIATSSALTSIELVMARERLVAVAEGEFGVHPSSIPQYTQPAEAPPSPAEALGQAAKNYFASGPSSSTASSRSENGRAPSAPSATGSMSAATVVPTFDPYKSYLIRTAASGGGGQQGQQQAAAAGGADGSSGPVGAVGGVVAEKFVSLQERHRTGPQSSQNAQHSPRSGSGSGSGSAASGGAFDTGGSSLTEKKLATLARHKRKVLLSILDGGDAASVPAVEVAVGDDDASPSTFGVVSAQVSQQVTAAMIHKGLRKTQLVLPREGGTSLPITEEEDDAAYAAHDRRLVMASVMKKVKNAGSSSSSSSAGAAAGGSGGGGAGDMGGGGSDAPLKTAAVRAYEKAAKETVFAETLLRVRFPDGAAVSAYFHPLEGLGAVHEWLMGEVLRPGVADGVQRPCVTSPGGDVGEQHSHLYRLRFPLGTGGTAPTGAGAVRGDTVSTLLGLQLVPGATVHLTWSTAVVEAAAPPCDTLTAAAVNGTESSAPAANNSSGRRVDSVVVLLPSLVEASVDSASTVLNGMPVGVSLTLAEPRDNTSVAKAEPVVGKDAGKDGSGNSSGSSSSSSSSGSKTASVASKPKWFKLG